MLRTNISSKSLPVPTPKLELLGGYEQCYEQ